MGGIVHLLTCQVPRAEDDIHLVLREGGKERGREWEGGREGGREEVEMKEGISPLAEE